MSLLQREIAPLWSKDTTDLLYMRIVLESEALELAQQNREHHDTTALAHVNDALARWSRDHATHSMVRSHQEFHLRLAGLSGQQRLVDELKQVMVELRRYFAARIEVTPTSQMVANDHHRSLLMHVMEGQSVRFRDLVSGHIRGGLGQINDSDWQLVDPLTTA